MHLTSLHDDHTLSSKIARNYLGSTGLVAPSEAHLKPNYSAQDKRLLIQDRLQCQTCTHILMGGKAHRRLAKIHGNPRATVAQFQIWACLPKSHGRWLLRPSQLDNAYEFMFLSRAKVIPKETAPCVAGPTQVIILMQLDGPRFSVDPILQRQLMPDQYRHLNKLQ